MLFNIIKKILYFYYKIIYFSSVEGLENIPNVGGMQLCANHKHFNDPLIITSFLKFKPSFLAKKELFKKGIPSWFLSSVGCIPIDRSVGELKILKYCINLLKENNILMIFPEGTRYCKHIDDVKSGAIVFAIKSQTPIVPIGISKLRPFSRAKVRIGKPIYYTEYYDKRLTSADYDILKVKLMDEIFSLVDEKCSYYNEIKDKMQ